MIEIGYEFNQFKTISLPYRVESKRPNRGKSELYIDCQCSCGNIRKLKIQEVKEHRRNSCGCKRKTKGSFLDTNGDKVCNICNQKKTSDYFQKSKESKDGLMSICKQCRKSGNLKTKYGISLEDYYSLLAKQGGKCACCQTTEPGTPNRKNKVFVVDHCHKTGKVRGLLCFRCNTSIGNLGDDAGSIYRAYLYLKKFEDSQT